MLAPIASAAPPPTLDGSDYVVLPGQTITFSNITLNSCHSDQAGVNIQAGDVQVIAFGNNTGFECTAISLETTSFTNGTEVTQTYRLWLQDNSCSIIYFADGNHAKVSRRTAALNGAGDGCFANATRKGKRANLSVSVSVE